MREWESGSVREGEKDERERAANLIEKKDILSLRAVFSELIL